MISRWVRAGLAAATLFTSVTAVQADEGMWMPQQLPQVAKQLKAAGLKLDPASLTKLTEFPMGAIVSPTATTTDTL